jgi:hypothetical protein
MCEMLLVLADPYCSISHSCGYMAGPSWSSTALRYDVAFFWSINPFYHMYAAEIYTRHANGILTSSLQCTLPHAER